MRRCEKKMFTVYCVNSFNSIWEVQRFISTIHILLLKLLMLQTDLGLVLGSALSSGHLLSVLVCEFPLLQRPPVAPEALTDTTQVFPLGRHILSTFQSWAKSSTTINPGRTPAPPRIKFPHQPGTCALAQSNRHLLQWSARCDSRCWYNTSNAFKSSALKVIYFHSLLLW